MQALKSEEMSQLQREEIDKLTHAIKSSYKSETQNSIPEVLKMGIIGFSNNIIGLYNTSVVTEAIDDYVQKMEVHDEDLLKKIYSQLQDDKKNDLVNLGKELLDREMKFNNIIHINSMMRKIRDYKKVSSIIKISEEELKDSELRYYCIKRRLRNLAKRISKKKQSKN